MPQKSWWRRTDLEYRNSRLFFAGRELNHLAHQLPTPAFVYSVDRFKANIERIHAALNGQDFKQNHQLYYAMKANRFAPLLTYLKSLDLCGVDACSPAEVELAMSCGFSAEQISFTAGSLSKNDFSRLAQIDGLIFNCDSLHSIKTWGELKPGSSIGIRINPALGTARASNEKLQYAGAQTTKFGIYREQFVAALELAESFGLKVIRIHYHTGCGYLNAELNQWQKVLQASLWFVDQCKDLQAVNIGGGLGVPHTAEDQALDLTLWANMLFQALGHLNLKIELEPGEYIAKDAGVLLLEKTLQETKRNKTFVGVNAGFNIAPEPVYYDMPFEPVALEYNDNEKIVSVIGNINEAMDVWYHDIKLPDLSEQDYLAIINCGAYSSSMASNHCMRGQFSEFLLFGDAV